MVVEAIFLEIWGECIHDILKPTMNKMNKMKMICDTFIHGGSGVSHLKKRNKPLGKCRSLIIFPIEDGSSSRKYQMTGGTNVQLYHLRMQGALNGDLIGIHGC